MSPFRAAHASGDTWRECVTQCAERLGRPGGGLGFVYFTDALVPYAAPIVESLREKTGVSDWIGTVGIGIIASGTEYLDAPALAVMVAEDAERLWQKLRLTNNEHARLASMAEGWRRISPTEDEKAARALLYRLKGERYTDRVLLAWARSQGSAHDQDWRALVTLPEHWTVPAFPLKAADFIARGVEKGPALGEALKAAEAAWIAAGFSEVAQALDLIADKAIERTRR